MMGRHGCWNDGAIVMGNCYMAYYILLDQETEILNQNQG